MGECGAKGVSLPAQVFVPLLRLRNPADITPPTSGETSLLNEGESLLPHRRGAGQHGEVAR